LAPTLKTLQGRWFFVVIFCGFPLASNLNLHDFQLSFYTPILLQIPQPKWETTQPTSCCMLALEGEKIIFFIHATYWSMIADMYMTSLDVEFSHRLAGLRFVWAGHNLQLVPAWPREIHGRTVCHKHFHYGIFNIIVNIGVNNRILTLWKPLHSMHVGRVRIIGQR
jgi:hypothetical protein